MPNDDFFTAHRKQLVSETLMAIARRTMLSGLCSIYHGKDSDIYMALNPNRKKRTALKITTVVRQDGNALWQKLRHRNVLRMLGAMSFTILDNPVTVSVMPYKEHSLANVIRAESFGQHHRDFKRMRLWVCEVALALEYLHCEGLCHLNVTVENVVFTSKFRAQLCDFDSLRKVADPVDSNDVGLPWSYLPPGELWGYSIDLWSYGLLMVDCFTKMSFSSGAQTLHGCWEEDVQPRLRRLLQEQEFFNMVRMSYPACDIQDKKILLALDFTHRFLQVDPSKRIRASLFKEHPFAWGDGRRIRDGIGRDPIWTQVLEEDNAPLIITDSVTDEVQPIKDIITEPVTAETTSEDDNFKPEDGPELSVLQNPEVTPDVPVQHVLYPALISDQERARLVEYLNGIYIKAIKILEKNQDVSAPNEEQQDSTICLENCETSDAIPECASERKSDEEEAEVKTPESYDIQTTDYDKQTTDYDKQTTDYDKLPIMTN